MNSRIDNAPTNSESTSVNVDALNAELKACLDEFLNTPTHSTAAPEYLDKALKLIEKGADPHTLSTSGMPLLHLLMVDIQSGPQDDRRVKQLLDLGANIDCKNTDGHTALQYRLMHSLNGIHRNYKDIAITLIELGADPGEQSGEQSRLLLHIMVANNKYGKNNEAIEKLITKHKFDIEFKDEKGFTALQCCLSDLSRDETKQSCAMKLIELGAKSDTLSKEGKALLHILAEEHRSCVNWPDIEKLIIDFGADIECKDKDGLTVLQCCQRSLSNRIMLHTALLLVELGADPFDEYGNTLLHNLVSIYNKDGKNDWAIEKLVNYNCDILNYKDKQGYTALSWCLDDLTSVTPEKSSAALHNALKLIELGADYSTLRPRGQTFLHVLVENNKYGKYDDAIKKLVAYVPNIITCKDKFGCTLEEYGTSILSKIEFPTFDQFSPDFIKNVNISYQAAHNLLEALESSGKGYEIITKACSTDKSKMSTLAELKKKCNAHKQEMLKHRIGDYKITWNYITYKNLLDCNKDLAKFIEETRRLLKIIEGVNDLQNAGLEYTSVNDHIYLPKGINNLVAYESHIDKYTKQYKVEINSAKENRKKMQEEKRKQEIELKAEQEKLKKAEQEKIRNDEVEKITTLLMDALEILQKEGAADYSTNQPLVATMPCIGELDWFIEHFFLSSNDGKYAFMSNIGNYNKQMLDPLNTHIAVYGKQQLRQKLAEHVSKNIYSNDRNANKVDRLIELIANYNKSLADFRQQYSNMKKDKVEACKRFLESVDEITKTFNSLPQNEKRGSIQLITLPQSEHDKLGQLSIAPAPLTLYGCISAIGSNQSLMNDLANTYAKPLVVEIERLIKCELAYIKTMMWKLVNKVDVNGSDKAELLNHLQQSQWQLEEDLLHIQKNSRDFQQPYDFSFYKRLNLLKNNLNTLNTNYGKANKFITSAKTKVEKSTQADPQGQAIETQLRNAGHDLKIQLDKAKAILGDDISEKTSPILGKPLHRNPYSIKIGRLEDTMKSAQSCLDSLVKQDSSKLSTKKKEEQINKVMRSRDTLMIAMAEVEKGLDEFYTQSFHVYNKNKGLFHFYNECDIKLCTIVTKHLKKKLEPAYTKDNTIKNLFKSEIKEETFFKTQGVLLTAAIRAQYSRTALSAYFIKIEDSIDKAIVYITKEISLTSLSDCKIEPTKDNELNEQGELLKRRILTLTTQKNELHTYLNAFLKVNEVEGTEELEKSNSTILGNFSKVDQFFTDLARLREDIAIYNVQIHQDQNEKAQPNEGVELSNLKTKYDENPEISETSFETYHDATVDTERRPFVVTDKLQEITTAGGSTSPDAGLKKPNPSKLEKYENKIRDLSTTTGSRPSSVMFKYKQKKPYDEEMKSLISSESSNTEEGPAETISLDTEETVSPRQLLSIEVEKKSQEKSLVSIPDPKTGISHHSIKFSGTSTLKMPSFGLFNWNKQPQSNFKRQPFNTNSSTTKIERPDL